MALQRKFDEAADILERFAVALEGLGLNDPCLNDEIKELRERAVKIRTERDRFYNPKMNKLMAYEAEMMAKGRKSSYMSMKQRAFMTHRMQSGQLDAVIVSYEPMTGDCGKAIVIPIPITGMTVSELLKRVYEQMPAGMPPNSYGRRWVLRDRRTGRVFDIGSSWAKANGRKVDDRDTLTAGIRQGMELEAVDLPALARKGLASSGCTRQHTDRPRAGPWRECRCGHGTIHREHAGLRLPGQDILHALIGGEAQHVREKLAAP